MSRKTREKNNVAVIESKISYSVKSKIELCIDFCIIYAISTVIFFSIYLVSSIESSVFSNADFNITMIMKNCVSVGPMLFSAYITGFLLYIRKNKGIEYNISNAKIK